MLLGLSWMDWLGYAASAFVLISYIMSSILRLRIISVFGSVLYVTYGFVIHSAPTMVMNFVIVLINVYYLTRIRRNKDHLSIIKTSDTDPYFVYLLHYYHDDIAKNYPSFGFALQENDVCFYILRNMDTAGIFVGKKLGNGKMLIDLEYTTPAYRDLSVAKYLYADVKNFSNDAEELELIVYAETKENRKYFTIMGFNEDSRYAGGLVRTLKRAT